MVVLDRVIELLWLANLGQLIRRYEWFVISPDGGLVNTDRGLLISPDEAIGVRRNFSLVIVISSARGRRMSAPHIIPWLRSLSHTGCRLGAIGDAALLLAQAGLLDGYRCAVPESLHRDFASGFPDTQISREPFCMDRDRVTCTGAMAVVDMMLGVIGDEFGLAVAEEVADQLTYKGILSHQPTKDPTRTLSIQETDKRLVKAVDLMKKHIEKPMRIIDIARRVGTVISVFVFRRPMNYSSIRSDRSVTSRMSVVSMMLHILISTIARHFMKPQNVLETTGG